MIFDWMRIPLMLFGCVLFVVVGFFLGNHFHLGDATPSLVVLGVVMIVAFIACAAPVLDWNAELMVEQGRRARAIERASQLSEILMNAQRQNSSLIKKNNKLLHLQRIAESSSELDAAHEGADIIAQIERAREIH